MNDNDDIPDNEMPDQVIRSVALLVSVICNFGMQKPYCDVIHEARSFERYIRDDYNDVDAS